MVDDAIHEFCALQRIWLETELHAGDGSDEVVTTNHGPREGRSESGNNNDDNNNNRKKKPNNGTKSRRPGQRQSKNEDPSSVDRRTVSSILTKLESLQISVGLYGRTVVQLGRSPSMDTNNGLLPVHKFTTGDEVEIRNNNNSSKTTTIGGVICEVTESSISVALFSSSSKQQNGSSAEATTTPEAFFDVPPFALIPRSNIQVHTKMMSALADLQKYGTDHPVAGRVIESLFVVRKDNMESLESIGKTNDDGQPPINMKPFNPRLDDSQLEAISFALSSQRPVALIHGPPGTGKTTTVAELIQQAVRYRQMKVLVVAASNVAVDTLLSRLVGVGDITTTTTATKSKQHQAKTPMRVVRLGHPARIQPAILPYCLEALVQKADGTEIVQDVRDELQQYLQILAKPKGRDKHIAARQVKTLRKEIRSREEKVVSELIHNAHVVLATCIGAANTKLLTDDVVFDLVVIDEAAQALEAACWIAILRGKKLIMAGDHLQLPPTIQSTSVQAQLGVTLFERLMDLYGEPRGQDGTISRMLKVQYRMNENIANWASTTMYGGALATFDGIRHQTIQQLECVMTNQKDNGDKADNNADDADDEEAFPAMLLIDTAGCDLLESENASGSRYNQGEADLVIAHVQKLLKLGVPQEEVAVISPYNGQVELLRLRLLAEYPKLQIRSVDGFQGGEREAVVISLVRSHPFGSGSIGFLRDDRRLNVAITRAKRHCCVICDTDTVSKSPFIKSLIDWIGDHGVHQTADGDPIEGDLAAVENQIESFIGKQRGGPSSKKQRAPNSERKDEEYIEGQRKILMSRIETFLASAKQGETMIMSQKLSKLDRKIVHEIAEELGIEHVSYGEEGANRQIHLKLPAVKKNTVAATKRDSATDSFQAGDAVGAGAGDKQAETEFVDVRNIVKVEACNDAASNDDLTQANKTKTSFAILGDEANEPAVQREIASPTAVTSPPTLAELARERQQREQQKPQQCTVINPKPKIAVVDGKRLGGTKKKPPPPRVAEKDNTSDGLDDMAFLDAQIDQVQNSHGVRFEGKGKTYRTVVNGILLQKNKDPEPKKNAKASQSLQAKLQEAQKQRAAKPKKR